MKKLLITLATIVSFILFTGISGCEHKSPTAVSELSCVPGNVEYETVLGSGGEHENWVITNEQEWDDYINSTCCVVWDSGPPASPVSFDEKIIISTRMGMLSTSDYLIKIRSIETDCASITVKIVETDSSYCTGISLPASSQPSHTVAINKTDLPINFVYLGSDNDNDGYTDNEEQVAGTDSCDPNDHP